MRFSDFKKNHALLAYAGAAIVISVIVGISASHHLRIATVLDPTYRWRNDDGSEVTATYTLAENTPLTNVVKNVPLRLRLSATNPGTSEFLRSDALAIGTQYDENTTSVIDTTNGYAYFGTLTQPGAVIKVALGSGASSPSVVGSIILNSGEDSLTSSVIDVANGYAYFGTNTSPGRVIKIALGAGAAPPTRVAALTLNSGENNLRTAVIDTTNGYAYFATRISPSIVVKVSLGAGAAAPTRTASATLASGENLPRSSVIDTANGYLYVGTGTSPGKVVKVALGVGAAAPTRVDVVTLNTGENNLFAAVIDATSGYAYFGTSTTPGNVVKIALGVGAAAPTRVAAVTLNTGESTLQSAAIDTTNGYAYFGARTAPGIVVKVALGAGAAAPTRTAALALFDDVTYEDDQLATAVIDVVAGYAYFGTDDFPGGVSKIALGAGAAAPTHIVSITLIATQQGPVTGVIDSTGVNQQYSYIGTATSPGKVTKILLGDSTIATIDLNSGENNLASSVIDIANGYAYFGTNTSPGIVVKVELGAGDDPPTRIDAVMLNSGENGLTSAVIDTANGYAYFGTNTSPAIVIKVALGVGAAAPTRVGAVTLNSGENLLTSAAIDTTNGYAYFGTNTSPGIVAKVALGAGAAAPTRAGAVTLNSGENLLTSAGIDATNGYAYFGTNTTPGIAVKVALGAGAAAPTRTAALTLNSGENNLQSAFIDAGRGIAYFGTATTAGFIVSLSIAPGAEFVIQYALKSTTCAAVSTWTTLSGTGAHWSRANISNLVDIGPTTNSAGITDPNVSFKAGESRDNGEGTNTISLGEQQFTEIEYGIKATGFATNGATYCFRVANSGATHPFAPSLYPEATVVAGLAPGAYRWRNDDGSETTATYAAGQNTPLTAFSKGTPIRLRIADGNPGTEEELLRKTALTLNSGENVLGGAVIDPSNGYAYFGTGTTPAQVIKVALGTGSSTPSRIASLTLNSGENTIRSAVIDTTNGYAYFGTNTSPGIVVKVALGVGAAAPTRVGAVTLNSGENSLTSAGIDTVNGYAYFGSNGVGRVTKIALGAGAAAPTRIGTATLSGTETGSPLVVDAVHGYAYSGNGTLPGIVAKIDLGVGAAAPSRVGSLTLNSDEGVLVAAVIDPTNSYAYFGNGGGFEGRLVKIALGVGAALPTRTGAAVLTISNPFTAAIDTTGGFAYLASATSPTTIVQVALGVGAAPPFQISSVALNSGENASSTASMVADPTNGLLYVGTNTSPGRVVKISIAPQPSLRLEYAQKSGTCAASGPWARVGVAGSVAGEHWQMADSTNLTNGAVTTNSAGITDANTTFKAGFVQDTTSETSPVILRQPDFTEVEYSIQATNSAQNGATYCFRLTDAGTYSLLTTTNYPEAALLSGSPAGSPPPPAPGTTVSVCGDAVCDAEESAAMCPTDCFGVTPPEPTPEPPPNEEPPPVEQVGTPYIPSEERAETPSIDDAFGIVAPTTPPSVVLCDAGTLIKGSGDTVYYCGVDGKRYVFPNEQVFHTWFADFSTTITVSNATLAAIPLGGMIGHRPGVRMVKLNTDDKVYAVTAHNVLRWVSNEETAAALYGPNWNQLIDDITTEEFSLYTIGEPIALLTASQ